MTPEEYREYMSTKPDCGIMPRPLSAQEAVSILKDHFLGENWYTVNPVNQEQVNAEIVEHILYLYQKPREKTLYEKVFEFFEFWDV